MDQFITMTALLNPPSDGSTTHWATCPITTQPILGRVYNEEEEVNPR